MWKFEKFGVVLNCHFSMNIMNGFSFVRLSHSSKRVSINKTFWLLLLNLTFSLILKSDNLLYWMILSNCLDLHARERILTNGSFSRWKHRCIGRNRFRDEVAKCRRRICLRQKCTVDHEVFSCQQLPGPWWRVADLDRKTLQPKNNIQEHFWVESCNTAVSLRKTTTCRIKSHMRLVVYRVVTVYDSTQKVLYRGFTALHLGRVRSHTVAYFWFSLEIVHKFGLMHF